MIGNNCQFFLWVGGGGDCEVIAGIDKTTKFRRQ